MNRSLLDVKGGAHGRFRSSRFTATHAGSGAELYCGGASRASQSLV